MKNQIIGLFPACAFFLIGCAQPATRQIPSAPKATAQIPVRDFFRNPTSSRFALSPSGDHLAFLQPYKTRMNIFVMKSSQAGQDLSKAQRVTNILERDISNFFWKGNKTLVFSKDEGGDENFHLFSVDIKGKNLKKLTPFPGVRMEIIDDLEEIDENHVLIGLNKRKKEIFDVYRLNIKSGKLDLVAENPGSFTSWITDHNGKIRGAIATNGVNTDLYYRESEKGSFRKTFSTDFKTSVSPHFFTFDNKFVYASSNLGRDKSAIVKFDLAEGKELEKIFDHSEVDVEDLSYSKNRKVLVAALFTTWKKERHFFDAKTEAIFLKVAKALPGYEISFSSLNRDETKIVVRSYSDRSLGSFYLFDVASETLSKISEVGPWIRESEMAEVKPISYLSRDGLTINGYLTLPKNYISGKIPIVIHPHGGPWARDGWGFNPTIQWLANRGYGVLQMNFRGSTGYGRKFWEASFKQWGKTMQNDISDGVQWLIKKEVADPKRICIYGGSYGGYAVLAGLAFTPELYACGVDYVGVSNLFTFMKTIPPYWKPFLDMMYEMVGNPEVDKELMQSASPVFHVDRIKAPLFVVQGAKDPRVNIEESNQIVNALKAKGIEVPYLVKQDEGHGFHNEENRFEFYEAMEKFLEQHLKP